jgi:nitrogen fixation protein FixH
MENKIILSLVLVGALILVGCSQQLGNAQEELDLIRELQEIERELSNADSGISDIDGATETDIFDEMEETTEPKVDTSLLQHIEVEETELVVISVNAEDEDGDDVTYSFSAPLDEEGTWQTNYTDVGEYIITVTASDGENNVEQKILLVVNKKNAPPKITGLPETLDVNEGEFIKLDPKINDPNEDNVIVTYTAPFDEAGQWETDHTSAGEYVVTITASDGEAETLESLLLTVNDVNLPPVITGVEDEITLNEGETLLLEPKVTDLDGDTVELSISEPVGDDGLWKTGFKDNGSYIVTVTASDGKDTVSMEVKITVKDVNVPPQIIAINRG